MSVTDQVQTDSQQAPEAERPPEPRRKVTIPRLEEKMQRGEPIVQLAVYEYRHAVIADVTAKWEKVVIFSGAKAE